MLFLGYRSTGDRIGTTGDFQIKELKHFTYLKALKQVYFITNSEILICIIY